MTLTVGYYRSIVVPHFHLLNSVFFSSFAIYNTTNYIYYYLSVFLLFGKFISVSFQSSPFLCVYNIFIPKRVNRFHWNFPWRLFTPWINTGFYSTSLNEDYVFTDITDIDMKNWELQLVGHKIVTKDYQ